MSGAVNGTWAERETRGIFERGSHTARAGVSCAAGAWRVAYAALLPRPRRTAATRSRTMARKKKNTPSNVIAQNRKARHDYAVEDTLEAGIVLEGWEVKSLRDGRLQLRDSFAAVRNGEVWLSGAHISPLGTVSTHVTPAPSRDRKLLLKRGEISRLVGAVERRGYTLIALDMHWKRNRAKVLLATARGKKRHDKRTAEKDRDWERERARLLRARRE